ncbi:hypothetical protein AC579_1935 [Pseudocercospora musae]|uniref:Uncharacterized protein n=1 Tax=Pseudocercospora musae TaxID=113226 RepID=A0A139I7Y7_9PEZI|nr:hypothetical protein AC579_1935 [Pseudocercospora musae]
MKMDAIVPSRPALDTCMNFLFVALLRVMLEGSKRDQIVRLPCLPPASATLQSHRTAKIIMHETKNFATDCIINLVHILTHRKE